MEVQLSTPVKLVALVGLLLAVVGGGGMMFLAPGGDEGPLATPLALPRKADAAVAKANAATSAKQAAAAPAPVAKPKATQAQPKAAAKPQPAAKPASTPAAVPDSGLPQPVATALATNRVVVVALFAPESAIDELALAEAQAGAKAAEAGFVAVNVLREGQGRAIARLLGVTDSPTLLVYRAPGTLAFRLDGFADLDTVAQAALDARRPGS